MSDNDNKLATGLYYDRPRDGAPDYVLGSIAVKPHDFIAWLNQQTPNERGYVRMDILTAKATGKPYVKLNDWKPSGQRDLPQDSRAADNNQDVPF